MEDATLNVHMDVVLAQLCCHTLHIKCIISWITILQAHMMATGVQLFGLPILLISTNLIFPMGMWQRKSLCYRSIKLQWPDQSNPGKCDRLAANTDNSFMSEMPFYIPVKCVWARGDNFEEFLERNTQNCAQIPTAWQDILVKPNVKLKLKCINNVIIFAFHSL